MKKLQILGRTLSVAEQRKIFGGDASTCEESGSCCMKYCNDGHHESVDTCYESEVCKLHDGEEHCDC